MKTKNLSKQAQHVHRTSRSPLVQERLDAGTVTLPNRAHNKSAGMLGSRRSDDVAPRLHRRRPEGFGGFLRT